MAHGCRVTGLDANESGVNERLIEEAGLLLVKQEEATSNAALVSGRWHESRRRHRDDLLRIEG